MKIISQGCKDRSLILVLQDHFKGKINLARVKLICLMIEGLCKAKSVNYDRLSSVFNVNADKNSCYRRIQRFMAEYGFAMETVSKLIFGLLPIKDKFILVLDRTNWKFGSKNINILMLGICYKNVAFPIMFKMLDKRGNSDTVERIELINTFIKWFGKDCIDSLLADREFVGATWMEFLNNEGIRYYLRIRNNFRVFLYHKNQEIQVSWLFHHLKVGQCCHYTKIVELHGQPCYLSATKTINQDNTVELMILVSFNKPEQALVYYKQRWQVETLFRGLKSSGFNIEATHVTHLDRLEKLFSLTLIAFTWSYIVGDFINENFKKITIKKHGHRAVSIFKYGLDYLSRFLYTGYNPNNFNLFEFLSCT